MSKIHSSTFNSKIRILKGVFYLITLALLVHWCLLYIFKVSGYKEIGVWNEIISGNINASIVFVGSSRTSQHFDTPWINENGTKKSYNLGMDGSLFDLQYERLKLYLNHNESPSEIYIGVDIESFQRKNGIWNEWSFNHLLNQKGLFQVLKDYDDEFLLRKYLPLYAFAKMDKIVLLRILTDLVLKTGNYKNGYIPVNIHKTDELWDNSLIPSYFTIDEYYIRNLEKLVSLALSVTDNVSLVYTPEHISAQSIVRNRNEILGIYKEIADDFGLEFLDYSHFSISKQSKYFYNSQHLNADGARHFTKLFFKEIYKE